MASTIKSQLQELLDKLPVPEQYEFLTRSLLKVSGIGHSDHLEISTLEGDPKYGVISDSDNRVVWMGSI